jgi:hypothetical protein
MHAPGAGLGIPLATPEAEITLNKVLVEGAVTSLSIDPGADASRSFETTRGAFPPAGA